MFHQQRSEPSDHVLTTRLIGRRDALRRLALVPAVAATAAFLTTGSSAAAFDFGDLPIPIPGVGSSGDPNDSPLPTLPPGVTIPDIKFGGKNGKGGVTLSNNTLTLPNGQQLPTPQLDAQVPLYGEVLPGALYRSAQPSPAGFAWLKANGIRTIVDLRDEHDDASVVGPMGFGKYVYIPIVDNTPPTNAQAEQFLALVTNRGNWPILVHCNYGVGRAGTMTVLTRYAVQGMAMDDAYASSVVFGGGPFPQAVWLLEWAQTHAPGDHPISG
jgi:protein tyrosine phosphatase (PTP) superfamily phosphohydrolase (DUF442 family)